MLLVELNNVKKYFGDRLILEIDDLKIYSEDNIGIVGVNGVGKTTLINILSKRLKPDEGYVKLHRRYGYVSQLEDSKSKIISGELASKFGIKTAWNDNMSGGEKTKFKIAEALDLDNLIIFADEPTSNLDMDGIDFIENRFSDYNGSLVIISHDRRFLDKLCNKILEIENGKAKIYNGNYSDYQEQKVQERERAKFEYEKYLKEKKRLEEVINKTKLKSKNIKQAPKRMGNSEARLHKMGGQKAKAGLDNAVKNVRKRIEHLEEKDKPVEQSKIKLDILESSRTYSKILVKGKNINKSFGNNVIFKNANFYVENGSRVALIGPNGCGKSTLINMIMNKEKGIKISKTAKIGYFNQDLNILNKDKSILENVMESSIYSENFARLLLARLLFKGEGVYKKVNMLSGGELVKISFVKILLEDFNMLILDEPTNYLDVASLEVIEEALNEYERTLLFISHDRQFVKSVANQIMTIEDKKINLFKGKYEEFLYRKNKTIKEREIEEKIILLNNRLSVVMGKLNEPLEKGKKEKLEKEFQQISAEIKKIKSRSY